ncbi:MAG: PAS domain-containing protein [Lysobacter sp.]
MFRDMLDRLPIAAYACDAQGLITYFNAKAVETWGRAPTLNHESDRFCGSYRLFSAQGAPIGHDECWMARALHHRREYLAQEILIERPNAALVPVLAYATPLLGEDGEVVAGINMLVDISERKRMERLLKDANETKNQYMATLADELRTQLGAISEALVRVESGLAPAAPSREAIQLIHDRMSEMTSLIEDLLDMPRAASPDLGSMLRLVGAAVE